MSRAATNSYKGHLKASEVKKLEFDLAHAYVLDILAVVAVGLFALFIFGLTLAPTVTADDAGELVTAAYELGVPHPPGYPLWCMLTHAWMMMFPMNSDVALRANLFSACCSVLTCVMVFRICRLIGAGILAAMGAAMLLAVSREFWSQSVIAEVYALNALIFTLCIWLLVKWDLQRSAKWLILYSLTLGLGLTNHHTIGIMGPIGLIWVACRDWRVFLQVRTVICCVAIFVLALGCYGYLMWRAQQQPYMNWGDPSSWSALIGHVTRAQYKANYEPADRTLAMVTMQLLTLLRYYLSQFSPAVGLGLLIGIPWMIWKRRSAHWLGIGLLGIGIAVLFAWLLNTKPERQEMVANEVFFTPAYIGFALTAAGILDELIKLIRHTQWNPKSKIALILIACVAPTALAMSSNYASNDFSDYWYAEDHARNLLATVEPNGVIFPSGDHNTFPLIYQHQVKQFRKDVTIADKYGYVEARDFPEVAEKLKALTDESQESVFPNRLPQDAVIAYLLKETDRPVYFTVKTAPPLGTEDIKDQIQQNQVGLLYRIAKTAPQYTNEEIWKKYRYRNLKDGAFDASEDYGAINVVTDYWFYRGMDQLANKQMQAGVASMKMAAKYGWGIKEVFNNIGSALAEYGAMPDAIQHYQEAVRLDDMYPSAQWNLARIANSNNRWDDAAGHYKKLLQATPEDFRVPGELGYLYLNRKNQTKEAVGYFKTSLALNDNQPQIQSTMQELNRRGAVPDAKPVLKADQDSVDLGHVLRAADKTVALQVKNLTDQLIKITDVAADCGCTDPSMDRQEIPAGESATLTIRFNEDRKLGKQNRKVTIRNDAGPPLIIQVQAEVLSPVTCEPGRIDLKDALPNTEYQLSVKLTRHMDGIQIAWDPVKDQSFINHVESEVIDDKHMNLKVDIKTSEETGDFNQTIRLTFGDAKYGQLDLPVRVHVRDVVQIEPRSLFLKSVPADSPVTHKVNINLPPDWNAKIIQKHLSVDWIELVDCPTELKQDTELTIRIDPAKAPERFSGSVGLVVDNKQVPPIVIPVYGYIKSQP